MSFYQHLSSYIDPIIFSIGSFPIRWYSVMYLIAFAVFYLLITHRIRKGECFQIIQNSKFIEFMLYGIFGLLIGARLGYVLFYDFFYFIQNSLEIILPGSNGISGMSYHGGLIGIILATLLFTRKNKLSFWKWADFIIPAIPAAYFFGRIGNFLNGELYGRATHFSLGMYFPLDRFGFLRHPSQLYEAFFEGIILFFILWKLRNRPKFPGYLAAVYLFGYGFFRFCIEFFREPDGQIGLFFNLLTLGQTFSLIMIVGSLILFWLKRSKYSPSV